MGWGYFAAGSIVDECILGRRYFEAGVLWGGVQCDGGSVRWGY